jgi:hypothetical protein
MRIFGFRLPFRPNLVRMYKRQSRGESGKIFEWVLPVAKVRKFSLGSPLEKTRKTRKTNLLL